MRALIRITLCVVILSYFIGCITFVPSERRYDDRIVRIYREFQADALKRCIVVPDYRKILNAMVVDYPRNRYLFLDSPKDAIGLCAEIVGRRHWYSPIRYSWKEIFIFPSIYDYQLFKLTVYHELGHCVLNLPHDKRSAIMRPYIRTIPTFRWRDAVDELFDSYKRMNGLPMDCEREDDPANR